MSTSKRGSATAAKGRQPTRKAATPLLATDGANVFNFSGKKETSAFLKFVEDNFNDEQQLQRALTSISKMANKFMKKMYLRWKKLGVDEKQQYAQAITGTGQRCLNNLAVTLHDGDHSIETKLSSVKAAKEMQPVVRKPVSKTGVARRSAGAAAAPAARPKTKMTAIKPRPLPKSAKLGVGKPTAKSAKSTAVTKGRVPCTRGSARPTAVTKAKPGISSKPRVSVVVGAAKAKAIKAKAKAPAKAKRCNSTTKTTRAAQNVAKSKASGGKATKPRVAGTAKAPKTIRTVKKMKTSAPTRSSASKPRGRSAPARR